MKKILYTLLLLATVAGVQTLAGAVVTTERKIINMPQAPTKEVKPQTEVQTPKSIPLVDNLKTCKPYSESMKSDYMGMNIYYKINIVGWVNDKCRLDFVADAKSLSSSFKTLYGVDPSDVAITTFTPKVRCEFTKQQLDYVGDTILQEDERNSGVVNNMLKDPNNINLSNISSMSAADAKLLDVIMSNNTCSILNGGDLNNMIQNLMNY